MSVHSTEQAVRETPVDQPSPSEPRVPLDSTVEIPESVPAAETTVYRDANTVLRIRPTRSSTAVCCLTMYWRLTEETQDITPERASHWSDSEFEALPAKVDALPDVIRERYIETVETLTSRFDLSVVRPTSGYGVCHYRLDSVGDHGIAAFETCLG